MACAGLGMLLAQARWVSMGWSPQVALSGISCPMGMGQPGSSSSGWQEQPLFIFAGVVVWVNQPLWPWKVPESRRSQIPGGFLEGTILYSAVQAPRGSRPVGFMVRLGPAHSRAAGGDCGTPGIGEWRSSSANIPVAVCLVLRGDIPSAILAQVKPSTSLFPP